MVKSSTGDLFDAKILAIDDEEPYLRHLKQVLQAAGYSAIVTLQDSRQAVETVLTELPDIVLLDVNMPYYGGYEVLSAISKKTPDTSFLPVLMCTSESSVEARQRALKLGASDFITKPYDETELLLRVRNFLRTRYLHQFEQKVNARLEHRMNVRTQELAESRCEAYDCLMRIMELRFAGSIPHMKRVGRLCEQIGRTLKLEEGEVDLIGLVAPFYDLGRICLNEPTLDSLREFTTKGDTLIQRHTLLGESIIGLSGSPLLKEIKIVAKHHHERWDGSGFPDGLRGEAIPLCCRITAVAVVFDLLSHADVNPMPRDEALKEIQRLSGSYFDPGVVTALLKISSYS